MRSLAGQRRRSFLFAAREEYRQLSASHAIKSSQVCPGCRRFRQGCCIRTGVESAKDQTFLNTERHP
jgi:hypothetical protein